MDPLLLLLDLARNQADPAVGLSERLMDGFEIASKSVAIVGGILLACKAVREMRSARAQRVRELRQRASELRWKQAGTAREIFKEFHDHVRTMDAMEMLDWGAGRLTYPARDQSDLQISEADVVHALTMDRTQATEPKDRYVWSCFDWLFHRLDQLEHHVRTGLLRFEDLANVFRPYAARIRAHPERYRRLIATQDYRNVEPFLARFEPRAAPSA